MNTGAFGENFPYSNFHDLNTDWIVKIAKDFLDQYTHIQEIIEQGKTDITNLTETELANLQTKYETLDRLLTEWYNEHSEDIANQLADALQDLNETLAENIASFTTEAQEIRDNVVETIPSDYTALSDSVLDIETAYKNFNYGHDYNIGGRYIAFERGKYYKTTEAGVAITQITDANFNCCKIPVQEGDILLIKVGGNTGYQRGYAWMDSDGNCINRSENNLRNACFITTPANAVYVVINNDLRICKDNYFAIVGDYTKQAFAIDDIKQGTYSPTTGTPVYTLSYSRTPILNIDDIFKLKIPTGVVGYFIYRYDSTGNYISRYGGSRTLTYSNEQLKNSDLVTAETKYISISIKVNSGDTPTTPTDVKNAGFIIQIMNKQYLYNELRRIENAQENFPLKSNLSYNTKEFEQGGLTTTGNEGTSYVYCRTPYIDINTINLFYKPTGLFSIIAFYDESKTFISRTSETDDVEINRDQETFQRIYNPEGNIKYVRFAIRRIIDGEEVESLPTDIINSDLIIELTGVSSDVYEQIYTLEKLMKDEATGTIPDYYEPYLTNKINAINTLEDSIALMSDNLIFITDYHYNKNAQHSPELIKRIVAETGINKLVFGGDAGMSAPLANMYRASRENGKIYQKLYEACQRFYPIIGNHEWNDRQDQTHEAEQQAEVYNRGGVYNFYLRRCSQYVEGMSSEGNYYFDSEREKIRYFVLQVTGQAKLSNETIKWLGDKLMETPNGYYVCVFSHYAYTGGDLSSGTMTGRGNQSVIRISQILGAVKTHSSVTVNQYGNTGSITGSYTFNFSNKVLTPIAIISGHTHWDASITANDSDYGILTIATTCDAFGLAQNATTHDPEPRQVGTTDEQAFDVVQIDITNRKLYMTRIGGGSNREFSF